MKLKSLTSRLADGIVFQFLMVGALSFSHIHDVVAAHGQAGWKSWLYPPSVDLLTVAAYRRIRANRRDGMAWCAFLLGLAASLAANVVDAWAAVPAGLVLAVAIGVWPAVALLVCTLLTHSPAEPGESTDAPAESAIAQIPAPVVPAASPAPVVSVQVTNQVAAVAPAAPAAELPPVPPALLDWARTLADKHQAENGAPIDLAALRTRLGPKVGEPLALAIHRELVPNVIEA
jgi:hypothetical protein